MDYRVLKDNNVFLLTDIDGDIPENHPYGLGFYKKDTRFLSRLETRINEENLICLASEAKQTTKATIRLTNQHMERNGEILLWRESVEVKRERFIYQDVWYEQFTLKNYYPKPIEFEFSVSVDADYKDMFIIRGFQNGNAGKITDRNASADGYVIAYEGTDDFKRRTVFKWDTPCSRVSETGEFIFKFRLKHQESQSVTLAVCPEIDNEQLTIMKPEEALAALQAQHQNWVEGAARVETDHRQLQRLVDQGLGDIKMLLTDIGYGEFPVAGLPWFGVPFGRDSLIAALQMLPMKPEIAKGTLLTMAAYQGKEKNPWRDEQPGKIMHELRFGELANTNQVPFTPYYGSIDSTPLFLVLLVEYCQWTGDLELFKSLEENVEAALNWIEHFGDLDGDGFVEYHQESSKGIANQGWKDSGDSVVHRNGDYAKTPIALSEVQGYVYQAKKGIASIYEQIGFQQKSKVLKKQADELKVAFEKAFWMENHSYYAIALDKDKKQVGTITSNPGHLLLSGILDSDKAKIVTEQLTSPKMFSGYGIRTMGEGEAGYNPMSYHDGSIWPHDNSLIFLGMSRNGHNEEAAQIIEGIIDASKGFEYDRLPELFCGFEKELGYPVRYPVACSPQAWAAGTPFLMVQSLLGLKVDSLQKRIYIQPYFLEGMRLLNYERAAIGEGIISFSINRNTSYELHIKENTTGYGVIFNGKIEGHSSDCL
jgi:glycogen debranching enzyme